MQLSTRTLPTRHNRRHSRRQAADTITQLEPAPTERSNLGPLTTTFVPPSHCSQALLACPTCTSAWLAQSCFVTGAGGLEDDTNCWPSATFYPRRAPLAGLGFYSPGTVCPTGHTSACGVVAQSADVNAAVTSIPVPGPMADGRFQFPMLEGETAVGCCPTGYSCAAYTQYGWQTCHMAVTSTSFAAMTCDGGSEIGMTASLPWVVGAITVSSVDLWAPLVQINWQSSDQRQRAVGPSTASATATATATKTATSSVATTSQLAGTYTASTGSAPSTAASTESSTASPVAAKLSIAAIAGITVSATVVTLLLMSLLIYLCLRRRHERQQKSTSREFDQYGSNKGYTVAAFKLPSTPSELPSDYIPHELHQVHGPFYELGAGEGKKKVVTAEGGRIKLDTQSARFGRSLGVEDDLESPVDGTSPFRLKRGNTSAKARGGDDGVSGDRSSRLI